MSRSHRAVKGVLAGAICLIASLLTPGGTNAAWAQTDPFELPRDLNIETVSRAGTPGLSEIVVDGRRRVRMVFLEWLPDGTLSIDCDDARAAGIAVPAGLRGRVPLSKLPIVSSSFDGARQTLAVSLMRSSDGENLIDLGRRQKTDGESGSLTWARLSYDLSATVGTSRSSAAGGLFELAAGRGNLTAATAFSVVAEGALGVTTRRLSSAAQLYLPEKAMTITVGDMISAGSTSQRPVRLGGIQVGSDFGLRPDLVTMPLPAYTGRVAVPTTIDIITGQQQTRIGQVQPGEFTVRNVPMAGGRGDAALVIRDALGRETIQNIRFYASAEMLPKDMSQFGASIGWVRRRYGQDHDTYDQLAATGFYRRGLSTFSTATFSAEALGELVNIGGRIDATVGGVALLGIETRVSTGKRGTGSQFVASVESSGSGLSGRLAVTWPTAGYADVASELGDPAPKRSVTGQVGFNAARFNLQLAGGHLWSLPDPARSLPANQSDFVDFSARYEFSPRLSFNSAVTYRHGETRDFAATIGLTLRFGRQGWGGANLTHRNGNPMIAAASYRKMANAADPFGYFGAVEHGRSDRINGGINWRNRKIDTELRGEYENGNAAVRLGARGSLILAGGQVFARSRSDGTFALVRAGGIGGLTIKHNHQFVGKTNRRGVMLVDDVIPSVASNFEIDPDKIPQDVVARVFERRMVVPRRTVGLVSLGAIRFIPRPVRLLDSEGQPLALGTQVLAKPSGEALIVGYDGFVETNGAGPDRALEADLGSRGICRFGLPAPIAQISAEDPPALECVAGADVPPINIAHRARRPGKAGLSAGR